MQRLIVRSLGGIPTRHANHHVEQLSSGLRVDHVLREALARDLLDRPALERERASGELIEHEPERVGVGRGLTARRQLVVCTQGRAQLFGRCVSRCAGVAPTGGLRCVTHQPEVSQAHVARLVEQDVPGLDVPMGQTVRMGGSQRARDLLGDPGDLRIVETATTADEILQRSVRHVLHHEHEPDRRANVEEVEHTNDVGMLHLRDDLRFAPQLSNKGAIGAQLRPQHLERDGRTESKVERDVDDTGTTGAEAPLDDVATNQGPTCDVIHRRRHADQRAPTSIPRSTVSRIRPASTVDELSEPIEVDDGDPPSAGLVELRPR